MADTRWWENSGSPTDAAPVVIAQPKPLDFWETDQTPASYAAPPPMPTLPAEPTAPNPPMPGEPPPTGGGEPPPPTSTAPAIPENPPTGAPPTTPNAPLPGEPPAPAPANPPMPGEPAPSPATDAGVPPVYPESINQPAPLTPAQSAVSAARYGGHPEDGVPAPPGSLIDTAVQRGTEALQLRLQSQLDDQVASEQKRQEAELSLQIAARKSAGYASVESLVNQEIHRAVAESGLSPDDPRLTSARDAMLQANRDYIDNQMALLQQRGMDQIASNLATAKAQALANLAADSTSTASSLRNTLRGLLLPRDLIQSNLPPGPNPPMPGEPPPAAQPATIPLSQYLSRASYIPGDTEEQWLSSFPPELRAEIAPLFPSTPPHITIQRESAPSSGTALDARYAFPSGYPSSLFTSWGLLEQALHHPAIALGSDVPPYLQALGQNLDRYAYALTFPEARADVTSILDGLGVVGRGMGGLGTLALIASANGGILPPKQLQALSEAINTANTLPDNPSAIDHLKSIGDAANQLFANPAVSITVVTGALSVILDPINWIGVGELRGGSNLARGAYDAFKAMGTDRIPTLIAKGLEVSTDLPGMAPNIRRLFLNEAAKVRGLPTIESSNPLLSRAIDEWRLGGAYYDVATDTYRLRPESPRAYVGTKAPWSDAVKNLYTSLDDFSSTVSREVANRPLITFPIDRTIGAVQNTLPEQLAREGLTLPKTAILAPGEGRIITGPITLSTEPFPTQVPPNGSALYDAVADINHPAVFASHADAAAFIAQHPSQRDAYRALSNQGYDGLYIPSSIGNPGSMTVFDRSAVRLYRGRAITDADIAGMQSSLSAAKGLRAGNGDLRQAVDAAIGPNSGDLLSQQRIAPTPSPSPDGEVNRGAIDSLMSRLKLTGPGGEERAAAGMDPRILKVFGGNLYSGDLGQIAAKEMIQNAVDATRAMPGGARGEVQVSYNPYERSITVRDNGSGMTPAIVTKELVDIGGTAKPEGASGGFGIAKVAIFANASDIHVVTTARVNGKLVRTTLKGSGEDWLNLQRGLKMTTETISEGFLGRSSGHTGTMMAVTLNPEVYVDRYVVQDYLQSLKDTHQLPHDLKVDIGGEPLTTSPDAQLPLLHTVSIKGSDLDFYVSPRTSQKSYISVDVLNNGLPQFNDTIYLPQKMQFPDRITVNVRASMSPDHPNYPFQPSREELRAGAKAAVQDYIRNDLIQSAVEGETKTLRTALQSAPYIGPASRGLQAIDTSGTLPAEFVSKVADSAYAADLSRELESAMGTLQFAIQKALPTFPGARFAGLGLGADYYALNIAADQIGVGSQKIILINPFSSLAKAQQIQETSGRPLPGALADQFSASLTHELAHQLTRGHNEQMTSALTELVGYTMRSSNFVSTSLENVIKGLSKSGAWEDFLHDAATYEANKSRTNLFGKISGGLEQPGPGARGGAGLSATGEEGRTGLASALSTGGKGAGRGGGPPGASGSGAPLNPPAPKPVFEQQGEMYARAANGAGPSIMGQYGIPKALTYLEQKFSDHHTVLLKQQDLWRKLHPGVEVPMDLNFQLARSAFFGRSAAGAPEAQALMKSIETTLRPEMAASPGQGQWKDAYDHLGSLLDNLQAIDQITALGPQRQVVGGTITTIADAQAAIAELATHLGPKRFSALEEAAREVVRYGDSSLQRLSDEGIISQQSADYLRTRYPHYTPIYLSQTLSKVGAELPGDVLSAPAAFNVTNNTIRKLSEEGSLRDKINPVTAMLASIMRRQEVILTNRATRAIGDLIVENGVGRYLKTGEEAGSDAAGNALGKISYFKDGNQVSVAMPMDIANVAKTLATVTPEGMMATVNRNLNNLYRAGVITYNPSFMARNLIRDQITLSLTENPSLRQRGMGLLTALDEAFRTGPGGTPFTRDLMERGSSSEGFFARRPEDVKAAIEKEGGVFLADQSAFEQWLSRYLPSEQNMQRIAEGGRWGEQKAPLYPSGVTNTLAPLLKNPAILYPARAALSPLKPLLELGSLSRTLNGAIESASRYAGAIANLERRGVTVLTNNGIPYGYAAPAAVDMEKALRFAAQAYRESTIDFAKGGEWTKMANPFIFMVNAQTNGMLTGFRALAGTNRSDFTRSQFSWMYRAGMTVLTLQLAQVATYLWNIQFPEYDNIPTYVKYGALTLMVPSDHVDQVTGRRGAVPLVMIPANNDTAGFAAPLVYALDTLRHADKPGFGEFAKQWAGSVLPGSDPVSMSASLFPAGRVLVELASNYDFFKGQPIESVADQSKVAWKRFDRSTLDIFKTIGAATGLSPKMLQYFAFNVWGGGGREITNDLAWAVNHLFPVKLDPPVQNMLDHFLAIPPDDVIGREQFLAGLSSQDKNTVQELAGRTDPSLPFFGSLYRAFFPAPGNTMETRARENTANALGLSVGQTQQFSTDLGHAMDSIHDAQFAASLKLRNAAPADKSWKQFDKTIQDLGKGFSTVLGALKAEYPEAAQDDPAKWRAWQLNLNNAIVNLPDQTLRGRVLQAAWHAIQMPTDENGNPNFDLFQQQRDEFKASLSPKDRSLLEGLVAAAQTPEMQERDRDMAALRPYWNLRQSSALKDPDWFAVADKAKNLAPFSQGARDLQQTQASKDWTAVLSKDRNALRRTDPSMDALLLKHGFEQKSIFQQDTEHLAVLEKTVVKQQEAVAGAELRFNTARTPGLQKTAQDSLDRAKQKLAGDQWLVDRQHHIIDSPSIALTPPPLEIKAVTQGSIPVLKDIVANSIYGVSPADDPRVNRHMTDFWNTLDKLTETWMASAGKYVPTWGGLPAGPDKVKIFQAALAAGKMHANGVDGKPLLPDLPKPLPAETRPTATIPTVPPPLRFTAPGSDGSMTSPPPPPDPYGPTSGGNPPNIAPPVAGMQDADAYIAQQNAMWRQSETSAGVPPEVAARGRQVAQSMPSAGGGMFAEDTPGSLSEALRDMASRYALTQRGEVNPPFASLRGGPTMASPLAEPGTGPALADYLERSGVHPEVAGQYRTNALNLNPSVEEGQGYYASGSPPRITLSGASTDNVPESVLVRIAQHEALHRYDARNGISDSPEYRSAIWEALKEYPQQSRYLATVPNTDSYYYAHTYTAGLDHGLSLNDLPPPLRKFYLTKDGDPILNKNQSFQQALFAASQAYLPSYGPPSLPPPPEFSGKLTELGQKPKAKP